MWTYFISVPWVLTKKIAALSTVLKAGALAAEVEARDLREGLRASQASVQALEANLASLSYSVTINADLEP